MRNRLLVASAAIAIAGLTLNAQGARQGGAAAAPAVPKLATGKTIEGEVKSKTEHKA